MKRYILTLLSCVLALVAYGADDSNTIGKMREEGKSFYDSTRDLLYELSPKEGENAARYKELGKDTREAIEKSVSDVEKRLDAFLDSLNMSDMDQEKLQAVMTHMKDSLSNMMKNTKEQIINDVKSRGKELENNEYIQSIEKKYKTAETKFNQAKDRINSIRKNGLSYNMPVGFEGEFGSVYVRLSLDSMKFVRGKDTTSVEDDYTVAVAQAVVSLPFLPEQEDGSKQIGFKGRVAFKTGNPDQRNRIYLATNTFRCPIIKDKVFLNLFGKDATYDKQKIGKCVPPDTEGTYVEFDCNGITDVSLTGFFDFDDYLVAMEDSVPTKKTDDKNKENSTDNNNNNNNNSNTTASKEPTKSKLWKVKKDDPTVYVPFAMRGKGGVSAQACFSSPFKVKNARNFVFEVNSAVVDFSDIHNAEGFKLPDGYWHEALSEVAWTGFFLKSMKVYFPEDFKLNDGADLTTAEVSNMFIDDYGFTGLAAVDNLVNKDLGNAGAHLEITKIAVEFYQDEFIKGELKGSAKIPFLKPRKTEEDKKVLADNNELKEAEKKKSVLELKFEAQVTHDTAANRYNFFANTKIDSRQEFGVPFTDAAYVVVNPGTALEFTNDAKALEGSDKKLKFCLTMNGELNLESGKAAKSAGSSKLGFDAEFKGITYQGLQFTNVGKHVSIQSLALTGKVQARFMGMTISLTKLEWKGGKNFDSDLSHSGSPDLKNIMKGGLDMASRIQFMSGSNTIAPELGAKFKTIYEQGKEILEATTESPDNKWNLDGIELNRIALKADFSVFSFDGALDIFKDDEKFGKGFRGTIDLSIKPVGLDIGVQAAFGKTKDTKSFHYWFAKATADFAKMKTPILLFPPCVYLKSVSGGAYNHMRDMKQPPISNDADAAPIEGFKLANVMNYEPDEASGLGFIAGIGVYFGTGNLATAEVELNIALTSGGALRDIRLGGLFTMLSPMPAELSAKFDNVTARLNEFESKLAGNLDGCKFLASLDSVTKFTQTNEETNPNFAFAKGMKKSGTISGWLSAIYVPKEKLFDVQSSLDVDLWGLIRGNAWFKLHTEPKTWYMRMGSYQAPAYVKFMDFAKCQTYMMMGELPSYNLPPLSTIAARELNVTNVDYSKNEGTLEHAKGFAFAVDLNAHVNVDILKIAYFKCAFGGGTDLMVNDMEYCYKGKKHHWRASGDIYGYFNMSTGLEWPWPEKKFPIFKGNMFFGMAGAVPAPVQGHAVLKFQCDIAWFSLPEVKASVSLGEGVEKCY